MNELVLNQAIVFHFALTKNDRVYVFQVMPGSPWEEIDQVFDDLKIEFQKLKEKAAAQAEEQKLKQEMANAQASVAQGE